MGKSDRRHSLKMRKRERNRKFKEREKRHREPSVAKSGTSEK